MSADETSFWQDQAALLDPLAYVYYVGTSQSITVTAGERWYATNLWEVQGSSTNRYHRPVGFDDAAMLGAGTTLTTSSTDASSFMYICKPSLVTGSDARYSTDPKALFFTRLIALGTLTQFQLGGNVTDGAEHQYSFPGGFTYGFGLHTSSHDVAWTILRDSGGTAGLNTLNEISDTTPIRFAEPTLFPFTVATFPKVAAKGVSLATGGVTFTYVKLPGSW